MPRSTELQRELLERHAVAVVRPYFRALGLDIDQDGNVTQLTHGAIVVGAIRRAASTRRPSRTSPRRSPRRRRCSIACMAGRGRRSSTGAGGGPIEVARGVDLRKLSDGELKRLEVLLTRASPEP